MALSSSNPSARLVVPARSANTLESGTTQTRGGFGKISILPPLQFGQERFPPRMAGAFAGGKGEAMASGDSETPPSQDTGLDAETLASLRTEIRAAFHEAFAPLQDLAGDVERTMGKMREVIARIKERRGSS